MRRSIRAIFRVSIVGTRQCALPVIAALLLVAGAAPAAAQDWLAGIARSAAQSAAQSLANRAVDAATAAASSAATGAPADGPAARQGGRPDMYDANGDRVWRRINGRGSPRYDGQALWKTMATCVAVEGMVDVYVQQQIALYAKNGGEYRLDQQETDRGMARQMAGRFRDLGVRRLTIDQAAPDAAGRFDQEVAAQLAALRTQDWSAKDAWYQRDVECDSVYSGTAGLRYDMDAGRGEGSRPAPRL